MASHNEQLHEMPGLYGPFSMPERVVQKIWHRRDFEQADLRLSDGRSLVIRSVGIWNFLGGPDFKGARLVIDGLPVTGDVEVHFRPADWHAHRHAEDAAYRHVVLHVVMFPAAPGQRPACDAHGREVPALVLLPLLNRGLEEYAADDALERMTDRDVVERIAELSRLPSEELIALLRRHATKRWEAKRRFAAVRIARLGWADAAHHAALEILGYARNRSPMLATASAHPVAEWAADLDPVVVFAERRDEWETHGIRPANQPLIRLQQYQCWVRSRPDWPARLQGVIGALEMPEITAEETPAVRRHLALAALRSRLSGEILGSTLAGSRIDTLVCDGFLPHVSALSDQDRFTAWFHWFMGDVPVAVRTALKTLGLAGVPGRPFCHGLGQGMLGWIAERDARASG